MKFDSLFFIQVIITFLIGGLTSYVASQKGRHPTIWFLAGLIFSWFALLVAMFLPPLENQAKVAPRQDGEPQKQEQQDDGKSWFYLDEAKTTIGPIAKKELLELWGEKKLNDKSYVWQQGMAVWKRASELPEIFKT